MNVLLINGSPNEAGCTYTALSEVAGALQSSGVNTHIVHIGKKAVQGCIACMKCRGELGRCVFKDDLYQEIHQILPQTHGFIIGSPVYFAGPNGSLCALLDRLFFSATAQFLFKPAAAVVSCRRGGASASFDRLNKYFTICQMPVVSSQYWNMIHGMRPEETVQDLEGLQTMRTLGHNMAWTLKNMAAGTPRPAVTEDKIATNFIR